MRAMSMVPLSTPATDWLRVSELVGVPATAVNLRQGVLRVSGKGGKERMVPMSQPARAASKSPRSRR